MVRKILPKELFDKLLHFKIRTNPIEIYFYFISFSIEELETSSGYHEYCHFNL